MTACQGTHIKGVRGLTAVLTAAAMLPLMAVAAGNTSDPMFVYVNPKSCYHWHTATNSTMVLPVCFPSGASSATLSVNGAVQASGITTDSVTVNLPSPRCGSQEDVYELSLGFDNGKTYTTRLGLVCGYTESDTGSTRCLAPSGDSAWGKMDSLAVIPVPYGTTSLTAALNGGIATPVDTGLGGAAGWYALRLKGGSTVDLAAETPEGDFVASLSGASTGFFLIVR